MLLDDQLLLWSLLFQTQFAVRPRRGFLYPVERTLLAALSKDEEEAYLVAECEADIVDSYTSVLPCWFGESVLGGYCGAHAIFAYMAHAFVRSTYSMFDSAGTFG